MAIDKTGTSPQRCGTSLDDNDNHDRSALPLPEGRKK